jgi:hypothetical protein
MSLGLVLGRHGGWAAGFIIGALLSLFSLYSLGVCVPALFHPGATRRASALLQVVLLMKLPLYGIGLYIASRMGSAAAFAAFAGCTLVPVIITVEAVTRAFIQSNANWRRAAAMHVSVPVLPAVEELTRQVAEIKKEEAREPLPLASQTRVIREGAA